jgi:uncharacterized membrane protein
MPRGFWQRDLLLLNIAAILLAAVIAGFPITPLRVGLGVLFVLFCPGYCLIAALYPRRDELDSLERIGLSFALSIAVVGLIAFILDYTPWGIRLYPLLLSVLSFILVASGAAWYRRVMLPQEERFHISFSFSLPRGGMNGGDKVLSMVLAAVVLGVLGTIGYAIAVPKIGERFTEFYALPAKGATAAKDKYPHELMPGEEGKVTLRLVNLEHEVVTYRIKVIIEGDEYTELGPLTLAHEEKWEGEAGFVFTRAGEKQKVEFLLYREQDSEPYRRLHLWVDVVAQRARLPGVWRS